MENSKNRFNRGVLGTVPREILIEAVSCSNSFSQVLSYLGLKSKGGNYKTLYIRLISEGIDFSGITNNQEASYGGRYARLPSEKLFVSNSPHSRLVIKKRILKENLLPYVCKECGQKPEWHDNPLVLVLDHINGISDDHRLDNLRFLCPNCNSQTPTFSGKANRLGPNEKKVKDKAKDRERFTAYRMKYVMTVPCINCTSLRSKYSKTGLCRTCFINSLGVKEEGSKPKKRVFKRKPCVFCGSSVPHYSRGVCRKCFLSNATPPKSDTVYPPNHELQSLVDEKGYSAVGRMLGVSDNAVRKRLKKAQMA